MVVSSSRVFSFNVNFVVGKELNVGLSGGLEADFNIILFLLLLLFNTFYSTMKIQKSSDVFSLPN